jgi:hypothetical protein
MAPNLRVRLIRPARGPYNDVLTGMVQRGDSYTTTTNGLRGIHYIPRITNVHAYPRNLLAFQFPRALRDWRCRDMAVCQE